MDDVFGILGDTGQDALDLEFRFFRYGGDTDRRRTLAATAKILQAANDRRWTYQIEEHWSQYVSCGQVVPGVLIRVFDGLRYIGELSVESPCSAAARRQAVLLESRNPASVIVEAILPECKCGSDFCVELGHGPCRELIEAIDQIKFGPGVEVDEI